MDFLTDWKYFVWWRQFGTITQPGRKFRQNFDFQEFDQRVFVSKFGEWVLNFKTISVIYIGWKVLDFFLNENDYY